MKQYKKLVKVEKKVTFDGVYFRIDLESSDAFMYEIVLFWIPESDYLDLVRYVLLTNGYDSTK